MNSDLSNVGSIYIGYLTRKISLILSGIVIAISLGGFIGWWQDIDFLRSWFNDEGAMNPSTSICLVIIASCTITFSYNQNRLNMIIGTGICLVILTVALKYLFKFDLIEFNIEKWFFTDRIGNCQIAGSTALCLTLMAIWILLSNKTLISYTYFIPLVVGFIGFSSFQGHIVGDKLLFSFAMAGNTAFCCMLFCIIALLIKRNPLVNLIASKMVGGRVTRIFFIALLTLVACLSYSIKSLMVHHVISIQNGIALMSTGILVLGSLVIIYAGNIFNKTDQERLKLEEINASHAIWIKSITIPIITFNAEYKVEHWNNAAGELYGYTESEAKGRLLAELLKVDFKGALRDELNKIMIANGKWTGEIRITTRSNKVVDILTSASVIKDNSSNILEFIAVHQDITRLKSYEKEISELNKELKTSNEILQSQVYDLESFTGTASHDLKSPLGNIIVLAELLHEELGSGLSESGQSYLTLIKQRAEFMNNLIQDLLKFSSLGVNEIQLVSIDLNSILSEIKDEIYADPLNKSRNIQFDIQKLEEIKGDPTLMRQVFSNLISNSVKYTNEGQEILISITGQRIDDQYIILLKDNGIGIEEKYLTQLFTPFKRFHHGYEGTGLGLTIVKRIVELLNGNIRVESEINKGTIFYLEFLL